MVRWGIACRAIALGQVSSEDQVADIVTKDIEEKDAEIKALREQIEQMNNRAKSDLDNNLLVEPEEILRIPIIEKQDPIQLIIKQLQHDKIEMDDYLKSKEKTKKKKVDQIQLKKDIFELDFMCE